MPRRRLSLALDVSLVLLGALLGIATNYATSRAGELPLAFRLLQQWSLPLVGVSLLLILVGRVWLFWVERPPSPKRIWSAKRPPYPGLEAFTDEDAGVFFGRERESDQLLDRLHPTLLDQAHRFVTVIGPSGVGKSSLVQAGLLPRLAQRRGRWVVVPPFVPEDQPIWNLAHSLAAALPQLQADTLARDLDVTPATLGRCADKLRATHGGRTMPVLLVLDQAEELLTRVGQQECGRFLSLLRQGLEDDPRLWIVATLRSEFLTELLTSDFAGLFQDPVVVGALDPARLSEVIEGPAAQAGLSFAPGVVNQLISDAGGGDALPLLAYTLQALFLRAGPGGTVTLDDYRQLGGVVGTLSRQADKVAAELAAGDDQQLVLETLMRFVAVGETDSTRRRVHCGALSDNDRQVVDAFVAARLLTSDVVGHDAVVEVAHEALFRQWPPLRQMIRIHAEELQQRTDLECWAQDWLHSGHQDAYLLRDERFQIAQQWAATHGDAADEPSVTGEFLDRSRRLNQATLERLSETVARRALAAVDHDPEQALLLALAALEECAPTALAQRALLAALGASRARAILVGHGEAVRAVAWSPDGRRLATASRDGTARIWETDSGNQLAILRGHADPIRGVAWSPDGRWLVTGSRDHSVRLWDATDGAQLSVLDGHHDSVEAVAWSPDGRLLASGSRDCTVRIWDAHSGAERAVLRGHEDRVRGVAWSPDSTRVAAAAADRIVRVWEVAEGAELVRLQGHQDWVESAAWSPDGQRLATTSRDRTARVWDLQSGAELLVLHGHPDWVQGVAWSPDGRRLVTASSDRTARVWDAHTGTELIAVRGHYDGVRGVAWEPNGQRIASASYDRTARVWDTGAGVELVILRGHRDWVGSVAWSPDGRRLATGSTDRTARVWEVADEAEAVVLVGHDDIVADVVWSPDGRRIATASADATVRIWDATSGRQLSLLRGHQEWIQSVTWSPDGRRLATASSDQTIRIWDTHTSFELMVLSGHDDGVDHIAWAPDGHHLATASRDSTARIWNAESGRQLAVLQAHTDRVRSVAWSPDSLRLATASVDRTARLWELAAPSESMVLSGHEDRVQAVAWAPDGLRLVTASPDRTARVWDARDGIGRGILCVHEDWVEAVAWAPDSYRIATASRDRTARVWEADTDVAALIAKARQRTLRPAHRRGTSQRHALLIDTGRPSRT
jgi:WD40 repeat protein